MEYTKSQKSRGEMSGIWKQDPDQNQGQGSETWVAQGLFLQKPSLAANLYPWPFAAGVPSLTCQPCLFLPSVLWFRSLEGLKPPSASSSVSALLLRGTVSYRLQTECTSRRCSHQTAILPAGLGLRLCGRAGLHYSTCACSVSVSSLLFVLRSFLQLHTQL